MTTLKKSHNMCLNWIVPSNVINDRWKIYIQSKKSKQLVFPNFYKTSNFFSHWDYNYLLLTRYFNSYTQSQDLLVAATCATLHRQSQDYFSLSVKCWNSVWSIKNKKNISKLSCTETASQRGKAGMSLPHPSPPKQVNLYARFLHDKYNFHLTLPSLTLGWKTGWTGPDFWNTELGHRGSFVLGYTGHDFSSVFYPRNCQRRLQPQQHWQKPFWAK